MPKAHRAEGTSLLPTGKNIASSLLQGVPSGRLPHVVCFVFDQSIVASDNRLSYACILLFPKSTKVSFGVPVFPLAMTKSALHGKTQAFASNRRTPTLRLGSCPVSHKQKTHNQIGCAFLLVDVNGLEPLTFSTSRRHSTS